MTAFISQNLFPTKISLLIFMAYIFFGICQSLLITASRSSDHGYSYNTITVVMLVSAVKLVASSALFITGHMNKDPLVSPLSSPPNGKPFSSRRGFWLGLEGCQILATELVKNKRLVLYFFIPAALYTAYDNLMFISLSVFTPTSYYLLTQCRIVITAVVFERLFHRKLSRIQWFSLFFLMQGCVVKELYRYLYSGSQPSGDRRRTQDYFMPTASIAVQIFCSCFASVYTEYLFKDKDSRVHPMVENVLMYFDNICCGLVVLTFRGQLTEVFSIASLESVFRTVVLAIILNQALMGLVTATFLRKLNSILKSFAAALELVITPFMCWMVFGLQVDTCTVIALCVVFGASCIYALNPVHGEKERSNPISEQQTGNSKV